MLRANARWPALRTFFDLRSRAAERNHRTGSTIGSTEQDRGAAPFGTLLSEVVLAGSALLILLVTQWVLAKAAPGANYFGLDGKLAQSLATTAFEFAAVFDMNNLTPIQGFGSQMLTKNVWANPAFWPFAFFAKETATDISALIALACFAGSLYAMMRCLDVPILPSAVAAQFCMLLFAPSMLVLLLPPNFTTTPADALAYAPYMVALGVLGRLHAGSWRSFAVKTAGISALILYSIYCDPLWSMVAAIAWAVPFAVVTFGSLEARTITIRLTALGCCLVVLVLSGAAEYLYTLSQYTARVQFGEVLDRPRVVELISTMSYSTEMTRVYKYCAPGWILGLITLRGRPGLLALATAASFVAWAGYSLVFLLLNAKWILPAPVYLEHGLFALYLAGAAAGYWGALTAIAPGVRAVGELLTRPGAEVARPFSSGPAQPATDAEKTKTASVVRVVLTILAILAFAIVPARTAHDVRHLVRLIYFPDPWANEPEMVDFFSSKIGLASGQPFRGSINFPPLDPTSSNTVVTLWANNVPTENEYGQLVIPEAFYFIHTFTYMHLPHTLNRFDLLCCRDPSTFWPMVQMLGVRYYATPTPLDERANPGFPVMTMPHRRNSGQHGSWHIYELPHPNVGDYSPTEVVAAGAAGQIAAIMTKPGFDYTRQVILSAPLNESLVPARNVKLSVVRGGYHLSGHSDSTSMVILPQEFSHCLRARRGNVSFVRANLMMTGAIFSGDIDTDVGFGYGIFSPGCRREDLADLKRLNLKIDQRAPHLSGDRLFPDWNDAVARVRAALNRIQW